MKKDRLIIIIEESNNWDATVAAKHGCGVTCKCWFGNNENLESLLDKIGKWFLKDKKSLNRGRKYE